MTLYFTQIPNLIFHFFFNGYHQFNINRRITFELKRKLMCHNDLTLFS